MNTRTSLVETIDMQYATGLRLRSLRFSGEEKSGKIIRPGAGQQKEIHGIILYWKNHYLDRIKIITILQWVGLRNNIDSQCRCFSWQ